MLTSLCRILPGSVKCLVIIVALGMCAAPRQAAAAMSAAAARQCVLDAGAAVSASDLPSFERLVDMDAILEQALDDFIRRARRPETAANLPPLLALLLSQAAMKEGGVRSLLLNETRAFVRNGVSSGAFAGRKPSGKAAQGLLAPLFANASTGRKEVRRVGTPKADGTDWLVPFAVHDGGNDETYDVVGRIAFAGGSPRLVRVENMEALLTRLADEGSRVEP